MRENVITTRAGRAGAKSRAAVSVQRPAPRRSKPAAQKPARQKSFAWKSALSYVPLVLKFVLAVSLGVLAFIGYRTAVSAAFFKVRTVDVDGATRASREEIRAAVLRLSNAGVWQSDLEAIRGELKSLPWVRDAVVTRVLPSGLRVRVTEREPRLIARNRDGRLVWADDDGVMLGNAVPGDEDFFIRGLDQSTTDDARRENRERMAVALELKGDWEKAGLSKRVSEIDLADLRDVRVHLAGADSGVQVSIITQDDSKRFDPADDARRLQDYSKRFRDALRALDQQGRVRGSQCVSYIVMSPNRSPVFGYHPCAAGEAAAGDETTQGEDADAPTSSAASASSATAVKSADPARGAAASAASKTGKKAAESAPKPYVKKTDVTNANEAALRPRRVN